MKKTLYTASTAAILLASVVAPNAAFAAENPVVDNQQTAQTVETTETEAVKATETEAAKATETEAAKATETEAVKATETEAAKATETEAVKATETEAAKATETEAVKATETEAAKATETEAVKATETEAAKATVAKTTATTATVVDSSRNGTKHIYDNDSASDVVSDIEQNVNADVANNLLGIAQNFHVFANEAALTVHTNGNVATGKLTNGNSNFGTNQHNQNDAQYDAANNQMDISYIQSIADNTSLASSSFVENRPNKIVVGKDIKVEFDQNKDAIYVGNAKMDHAKEVYKETTTTYIDFQKEFAALAATSKQLTTQATEETKLDKGADQNGSNYYLDLSNFSPVAKTNTIVLNISAEELAKSGDLTISGLAEGTNVIVNVDLKGYTDYTFGQGIKLMYGTKERTNHEAIVFNDANLLWNFNDSTNEAGYTGKITLAKQFQGTVLATAASLFANSNVDGSIIVDKYLGSNGETHRWDYQGTKLTETPTTPKSDTPTTPGEDTPTTPKSDTPTTPGEDTPTTPGEDTPTTPGEDTPTTPGEDTPTTPGEDTPTTPGEETTKTPGEETTKTPTTPNAATPTAPGEDSKTTTTNGRDDANNSNTSVDGNDPTATTVSNDSTKDATATSMNNTVASTSHNGTNDSAQGNTVSATGLPQTGDAAAATTAAGVGALFVALMAFFKGRRKNRSAK